MNTLKNEEIILIVVLLIFIFSPYQLPNSIQNLGPILFGILTIIMITMIFLTKYNPIVYIVLFAAIIKLLNTKSVSTQIHNNTSNPIKKSKQSIENPLKSMENPLEKPHEPQGNAGPWSRSLVQVRFRSIHKTRDINRV